MLLALEPSIEVDIYATCGGLGRPLNGRDRCKLWRKVRRWEANQRARERRWSNADRKTGRKTARWFGEAAGQPERGGTGVRDRNPAWREVAPDAGGTISKWAEQNGDAVRCSGSGGGRGQATCVVDLLGGRHYGIFWSVNYVILEIDPLVV